MRVTDNSVYAQMRQGLATRREHLERAQSAAMSGRRVVKPSDDPAAMAQARSQSAQESRAVANERTVDVALSALMVADSALDQVGETLDRARELALRAANASLNAEDRAGIGNEISALRAQVIGLANSQDGIRYVFGGYKDQATPFAGDGSYNGDTEAQQVEVSRGLRLPVGLTGDRVFGSSGGQDVFQALGDLSNALASNDLDGIHASLGTLEQSGRQVRLARVEIGGHVDAAEIARTVAQRGQDRAIAGRSRLLDIDPLDAYTELARAQQALQAAVAVASQLPAPGLASTARVG
jgi:flagellar hook-associated protein 3 FlgL